MSRADVTITSLRDFVKRITDTEIADDEVLLYRGHSRSGDFKLIPSVLRERKYRDAEHAILREMVSSHPADFEVDRTTLEQLVRLQHYSLPTRLLDVTWNPLVGLFFAVREHPEDPGEVVVFRVSKERVTAHDSDTASCLANLAHLLPDEKDSMDFALPAEQFSRQPAVDRLLQYVRVEKPYFSPRLDPERLRSVVIVKPKLSNRRIVAQSGAFLLFGIGGALDPNASSGIRIERLAIAGEAKERIGRELDRMIVNESTMFPEIERAALYIRSKL